MKSPRAPRRRPAGSRAAARRTAPGRGRGSPSASMPLASAAVAGITILSPARWRTCASKRVGVQLRGAHPAAERRADDHRHRVAALGAVAVAGELALDLVERLAAEAEELQFGHRHQPAAGQADRRADDRRLGQRGVDDALGAEALLQAVGGAEHAAVDADVLAEHDAPARRAPSRRPSAEHIASTIDMTVTHARPVSRPLGALGGEPRGGRRLHVVEEHLRRRRAAPASTSATAASNSASSCSPAAASAPRRSSPRPARSRAHARMRISGRGATELSSGRCSASGRRPWCGRRAGR